MADLAPRRTAPLKYPPHTSLRDRLNQAVDAYFESRDLSRHGGARMWLKSAVMISWTVASYLALVFVVDTWWQALLAAISLGLAVAGIGFNVQHDGGHGAYSSSRLLNRLSARTLDLIGGSSYMWNYKHNILHHHFTNVDGVDDDLEAEPILRLAPGQRRYWFHRFQYLYVWLLYGFLPAKWHWYDDYKDLITARKGDHVIPRPKGGALTWMIAGRALFFGWALILPLFFHPVLTVLVVYGIVALVTGVTISTVFQLAHCVEEADITPMPEGDARLPQAWAEHQLATTADFAPGNPILTSYLGGLNYQVEHHLFPRISHIHYPALARVVRDVCAESGVRHFTHPSVWSAVTSHIRFLKRMGRPEPTEA